MQTGIWMTYSDSTHFSDKISYKILFISSYHLKDTDLTKFAHLQGFSRKQRFRGDFSHRGGQQPGALTGGARGRLGADWKKVTALG
jgi:hypothetical protein